MSDPARAPSTPLAPSDPVTRQELPEGALTREQAERFEERLAIDGDAVVSWLLGKGPDPWLDESE